MKNVILISLFLALSCTQAIVKIPYVKKTPITGEFIYKRSLNPIMASFKKTNWLALIFIANKYDGEDIYQEIGKLCPRSDMIEDIKVTRKWFMFPILYFQETYTYEGKCHE